MNEGFRSLTAKEIRKQNERHGVEKREKKRRLGDGSNDDDDDDGEGGGGVKNGSEGGGKGKRYENDRFSGRKRSGEEAEKSKERYSDNRHKDDKRQDRGRRDSSTSRERSSSGYGHSRGRSVDRCSTKNREERTDRRDRRLRESDTKQQQQQQQSRGHRRSYHRNRDDQRSRTPRNHSPEDDEEVTGDRPAWATKAVMKRAEEIQKRKLIWSKPEEKKESDGDDAANSPTGSRPSTTTTWNSILAATSSDSKQLDKFKRLMGMKKTSEEGKDEEVPKVDSSQIEAERKRQRELYSHLDQQYAVARSFTHLSRGQGLGFHQ